jgi:beta-phosphoglucomutase-like phosphatase (HAD superfamily)
MALGLEDFFDAVVPAEEVRAAKPDPEPYRTALEKLGADPEEALAFEDSVSGIHSAVGAGIPTVGIASTQEPDRLLKAGAFMATKDFEDPDVRALIGG